MTPLEIVAELRTGALSLRSGLNIDAILAWKMGRGIREGEGGDVINRPVLPLARMTHGGHSVYMSTNAIVAPLKTEAGHIVRRRDSVDVETAGAKHKSTAGPQRNALIRVPVSMAAMVRWQAIGDIQQVRSLLGAVTHIGGLRGKGYGEVSGWSIREIDDANPLTSGGLAMRHLPAGWCLPCPGALDLPVMPPYWHRSSVVRAYPAWTELRLSPEVEARVRAREWDKPCP